MQQKKRVLVIFTGGTIVSGFQGNSKKLQARMIEFIHALACFSLLVSTDALEFILSKYLEGPF